MLGFLLIVPGGSGPPCPIIAGIVRRPQSVDGSEARGKSRQTPWRAL